MKRLYILLIVLVLTLSVSYADSDHGDFSEAKEILEQRIPYEQLTDDQFEVLGDYFMELMTGDRHEYMDDMMGGEGSESLKETHINMGSNYYQEFMQTGTVQPRGMMGGSMMGTSDWGHMMYPGTGHMFWGFGFAGVFLMILFWVGVIWLIYWIVQQSRPKRKSRSPSEILKARYARGEITKKQYEEMKRQLGGK